MWTLQSETNGRRVYKNSVTNSECIQNKCYTDQEGNTWWDFSDLTTIPFTRRFAADKINSLLVHGITPQDADLFFTKHKATLRSKDNGEKYEQAFAELIEFENKFRQATDPVKKMSSLVCVYFTMADEPIDSFADAYQIRKLSLLEADPQMHTFFLSELNVYIEKLVNFSRQHSLIASLPIEMDTN